jgi:hypothetical protein
MNAMERELISSIAHGDHPIFAPVSAENLDALLRRAALPEGARTRTAG